MSQDFFLGTPFNWVGAAALQLMLARVCDLKPGMLTWMGGDVHIYSNHTDQVKLMLTRAPLERPLMKLNRFTDHIEDFTIDDFILHNYIPHDPIKGEVAV